MKKGLEIRGIHLYVNDKEFKLYSGAIHYFRVHPSQWRDRLMKLKECGLNTVETYLAWNVQEPKQGEFCFDGIADFEKFIEIAEELGLYIIVRPGPYICAEWEMGGLPSWLLNIDGIKLRHDNQPFLSCVRSYFEQIFAVLRPHFSTNGGNIIAVQIENEYGGLEQPDTAYLEWIRDTYIELGVTVPMFTSDGVGKTHLEDGSLDGILMTANFGSRSQQAFGRLETLRPGEPKICMEFWNGWFDQWGVAHHTREPEAAIAEIKNMIEMGGHFNIYMFSGGTNFGFYNGSNCNPHFEPCITSYDYGAVLTEEGKTTKQYRLLKQLLTGNDAVPEEKEKAAAYGTINQFKAFGLFDNAKQFGTVYKNSPVKTMEELGQSFGYIMYEMNVEGMSGEIEIGEPHDRAMFYADDVLIGEYERGTEYNIVSISGVKKLKILIENMGRVNYGPRIYDKKGLLQPVKIGNDEVTEYDITSFPMTEFPEAKEGVALNQPAAYKAIFEIDEVNDTYLRPFGFTKGVIIINGFNLGRYWRKGPQQTLYVPKGILHQGKNEMIIFDLYPAKSPAVSFVDEAVLDMVILDK